MKTSLKIHRTILLLLCIAFLFACNSVVSIPDDVLPKEKMAEVMVDVHLLEAVMNLNIGTTDKSGINENENRVAIFEKHHVTREQYETSYLFYTRHPEIMAEVYQLVLNDLSKLQAEVQSGK